MCLHFLDLLQYESFRKEVSNGLCTKFIEDQQLLHWQHYIRKRTKLLAASNATNPDANQSANGSSENLAAANQLSSSVAQVSLQ